MNAVPWLLGGRGHGSGSNSGSTAAGAWRQQQEPSGSKREAPKELL